ncbi:GntR family transcriptional regulator [Poseidonocella sedimentorum]|uniref:DNA-binding transcriptional regulator, GntR family n=1 Tax=Poseidonocella sedimentorum TaxID=871652 RepID=A0A1I6EAF9_9RHOB|nr:GntR family transcriptional regulator [Poseidonocella sedimentorum]SFR14729.1 DNA-binding transcriptional regulator, GntR family [Poseidonocella sedimentorum]
MANTTVLTERRTAVDDVFDHLHAQISTLQLKPGDRISEAEIAAQFGVSRQPVRDAFSRLANMDLLLIRPQRATVVRRFSARAIEKARFIRTAIEKEVLVRASARCDAAGAARLTAALNAQEEVVSRGDYDAFGPLDYEFHHTLCEIAGADYAFDVILEEKAKVDRLCMLGHQKEQRLPDLVADHHAIADAVIGHDAAAALAAVTIHLSRLDETIERIKASNANYFDNTGD